MNDMEQRIIFGEWLRQERIKTGLSQLQLAIALGMSSVTINDMEQGYAGGNPSQLQRIADRFDADVEVIGEYKGARKPSINRHRVPGSPRPGTHSDLMDKPVNTYHTRDLQGMSPEKFIGVAKKILTDKDTWYVGTGIR